LSLYISTFLLAKATEPQAGLPGFTKRKTGAILSAPVLCQTI
jgi:hypothetical protein